MEPRGIMKAFPKVKRAVDRDRSCAPPLKRKPDDNSATGSVFQGVTAFILPASIGSARCQVFQRQILQNGGRTEGSLCPGVTHVVVDDSVDRGRALRLLKGTTLPPGVALVKCSWLSACIAEKRLLDTAEYSLLSVDRRNPETQTPHADVKADVLTSAPSTATHGVEDPVAKETRPEESAAETVPEDPTKDHLRDEFGVSQTDLEALISGQHPKDETPSSVAPGDAAADPPPVSGKWVCAQSSQCKNDNHNKHLTDKLEVLAKAYTHQGDRWRALGYSKAVNALKSYHKPITSYQEACRIPGIGKRMADKIDEILESGHLRKLDHMGAAVPVLELFTNIWGAGAKTAQHWYQQGFRTLEDISTKASLNHVQKIGLKHYDDFQDRMPRAEAAAIEKTVQEAVQAVDPGLVAMACGSYRRGKASCGDVDVLISHPDGRSHTGVFSRVLHILRQSGFLTDDLVSHEDNGEQKKYMGVCRLPGPAPQRHRRLDVIVVPYGEFACALLYFTGSAHFNRSMRALAKTKGMSLSEHSLNGDVLRGGGGAKVYEGRPLDTPTEKDVFSRLGIPFREPRERDW